MSGFEFLREYWNKTKQKFQKDTHINNDATFIFISCCLGAVRRSRCNEMNVRQDQARGAVWIVVVKGCKWCPEEAALMGSGWGGRKHGEPRNPVESLTASGGWEIKEGSIARLWWKQRPEKVLRRSGPVTNVQCAKYFDGKQNGKVRPLPLPLEGQ